jgi:hypothetical protein
MSSDTFGGSDVKLSMGLGSMVAAGIVTDAHRVPVTELRRTLLPVLLRIAEAIRRDLALRQPPPSSSLTRAALRPPAWSPTISPEGALAR